MTKARDLANSAAAFSAVSATELGYVDGVTSAIQTQIDAKIAKTLTSTTGDIIYASAANTPARLGIGSSAQVLTVASGVPSWATPAGGGGKVLQVVQGTYSTQTSNSTSTYADTGLSVAITPSNVSSKVLVLIYQTCYRSAASSSNGLQMKTFRAATEILLSNILGYTGSALDLQFTYAAHYLDSPATTSSTTYKTQFANYNNGASVQVQPNSTASTIIALEIGA